MIPVSKPVTYTRTHGPTDEDVDLWVAHPSDDRFTPVVAEELTHCAERAVEEYGLEYPATNIENWNRIDDPAYMPCFRFQTDANHWNYVSIHGVSEDGESA